MLRWVPIMLFVLAAAAPAFSDGVMIVTEEMWRQHREHSMINEPEQKAVVFFSKGTEQLIISPSYEGSASSFAWLIPVPARPKVEILKGAIFHELAKLVMPKRPVTKGRGDFELSAPGVTVIERKTVGAYDVSVLSATDSQALMKWLATNKYHLPPMAEGPVRGYIADKWTFVACRVKTPSSAKGLQTGTLAPLRFTFKTKKPVYPLKLSSANPKPFDLLVYLILPTAEVGKAETVSVTGIPRVQGTSKTYRSAVASGYPWKRRAYPTLAGLYKGEMQIYVQREYPSPRDCAQDIYWTLPSRLSAAPGGKAASGG
jgi:hypothetical protein